MQNQKFQQSLIESNSNDVNITRIYLARNRDMIDGLVDALKSINNTIYNNSLRIDSLKYTRIFFLTLADKDQRFSLLCNGIIKFNQMSPPYVST